MTTSLGSALPGFASTRTASEQPAGAKSAETGFSKILHDAGKQPRSERQPATETAPRDPRWGKPAATDRAGAESKDDAARKITSAKLLIAKTAKDDAGSGKDPADTAEQAANSSPLQDHLPLLMALHDLRHFSASTKTDSATEGSGDAPLDGQTPLSKTYRSTAAAGRKALDVMSRSDQGSTDAEPLGDHDQPGEIRLPGAAFKREEALAARPLMEAVADGAGTQSKPLATSAKNIEEALSAARPEAGKQSASANRVDVVSERSFPAPAQNPMSQVTTTVVDAIKADGGLRQAFSTTPAAHQMTGSVAAPAHILKIELHPAELGMVTASLRLSGQQLSIELKPESHEAYRRLTSDSEAIVKSLRGLGFDVDKVTILQPSIAVPAATRTDASGAQAATAGRDPSSFQSGNSSGNNGGAAGQQSGRNRDNDPQEFGRPASPSRERAGDDMFI